MKLGGAGRREDSPGFVIGFLAHPHNQSQDHCQNQSQNISDVRRENDSESARRKKALSKLV